MKPCRTVSTIDGKAVFDEERIQELSRRIKSLASPIRLKILKLLMDQGELCVCEIEKALGLKQSKVSYHLALLMQGGVIKRRESGPWSYYSLNGESSLTLNLDSLR